MNDEVKVLDITHADEVIREVDGGVAPTMQSRMGTGGNQVPLVMGFSHVASGMMLDCQPSPASIPLKRSPGGDGAVCVGVDSYNQSISPNVMHTLHHHDGLDNQAKVCLGFKAGQSANGGLGEEAEVSPTMSHQPSALEPTVCIDAYNQSATEESCMTLCSAMTGTDGNDADPKVVTNGVATMLKVRCGKDTYTKPDGSTGTAGKGPLASEESAFTLAATQDQSLVLRHIVRRLTPTECERLQAFPDGWTRIPYRGKSAEECPDSPRYKALGNSMATNCVEWVLRRIVAAVRLGMIGGDQ